LFKNLCVFVCNSELLDKSGGNPVKKRLIREIAVQSLYQMEMNEVNAQEAVMMLLTEAAEDDESGVGAISNPDTARAAIMELVNGVTEHKTAIDGMLEQYLKNWQISRLSRVVQAFRDRRVGQICQWGSR
jgi:transcription termination factor NusB